MTRLFFEYSNVSLVAGAAMIAMRVAWVLIVAPSPWLLPWLTCSAVLFGLRHRWRRQCLSLTNAEWAEQWPRWRRRALIASFGVAAMWMGALWDDFDADNLGSQMFCVMLACITCVGSINVMAPLPRAYWALAAPPLGLLALQFALLNTWLGAAAGLGICVGLALGVSMTHRHARLLYQSHALRFEREELIGQLEQTGQARTRFLAAASHDLRQPLHALGLLTDILQAEVGAHAAAGTVTKIGQMVHALDSMVDGMLDISRLDAGAVKPRPAAMPLAPLLQRLSASFALLAEARNLQWRQRGGELWVRSDPLQLERVLRNIVDNALHYTTRGGVLLGCRRRGGSVLLCVWDTGPGIAEQDRQRVFEEFVQLDNPGRDRRQGLGLGLAIVARLCRMLDHPLQLRSRPGRGSCFSILLPVVEAPRPVPMSSAATPGAPAATPGFAWPVAQMRVALVEDDDVVRDSTAALLRHWGCEVQAAADADGLIRCLGTAPGWQPAAIVSDHLLAQGSGLEAISRLRIHCGRQVPALLLSGQPFTQSPHCLAAERITAARKPLAALSLRAWLTAQAVAKAAETDSA